jgi:Cation transporting ATPase, C-terminus
MRRTANAMMLARIAAEVALPITLIYVPSLARIFSMTQLGARHWLVLAASPPLMITFEEIRKAFNRRCPRK